MRSQNFSYRKMWRWGFLSLCLAISLGCSFDDIVCSFGGVCIDPVIQSIDNGIADINRNSAMWADILQQVSDDLSDKAAEVVREEAQDLATRSIAQGGTEFKCSVDFLARRAIEGLDHLKQMHLGQKPSPLAPAFCLVAPAAVDLSTDPGSWDTITLHGYDLDHKDSKGDLIRFALTRPGGELFNIIEDSAVGRTTHYQITLSLRDVADSLHDQNIAKVVPRWDGPLGGDISGEVVIKPWRAVKNTRPHEPDISTWTPLKIKGDKDFDTGGNDPMSVQVQAKIRVGSDFVNGRVYMWARESKGDHTEVKGWSPWERLYDAPSGWEIIKVTPNKTSKLPTFQITDRGKHTYNRPAGEVVTRFIVYGDHKGNDAEGYTRVEADWNVMQIELKETQPSWYKPENQDVALQD